MKPLGNAATPPDDAAKPLEDAAKPLEKAATSPQTAAMPPRRSTTSPRTSAPLSNAAGKLQSTVVQPANIEGPYLELAYEYDGTLEGFFSAVFASYARREIPCEIVRECAMQVRLGQEIVPIDTDLERATRVKEGIEERFGEQTYRVVRAALLSDRPEAPTAVFRFIRFAYDTKDPQSFGVGNSPLEMTTHPAVLPVLKLYRAVMNEAEYMRQFIRFQHMENGVWFARCNPNAAVIPLIMGWFCARFNTQPFVIFDEVHHMAGIHEQCSWYVARVEEPDLPTCAEEEPLMQAAWKRFYRTLSIEQRFNPELRRNLMPMRFWRNLTELQPEDEAIVLP